jgi:nucleotide-binding universal stress UspA family protein
MYQTILVPLDGSKRAEAILSHVVPIAQQNKAKVVFLKVEEEPLLLGRDEVIDIDKYHVMFENKKKNALSYLAAIQSRFRQQDLNADIRLVYGTVVKSILKAAEDADADLIAMASHGLSGLARVSYGSVAAGVLQAAELPILLIRSADDPETESRTKE